MAVMRKTRSFCSLPRFQDKKNPQEMKDISEGSVQRFSICCCSLVMFLGGFLTAIVFFVSPQVACDIESVWDNLLMSYVPFLSGLMIGGYFFGALSDANGRKYSLHISAMVCFVASFMFAASSIFLLLDISKFLLGLGLTGVKNGCHVLIFELLPPSVRASRAILLDIIWSLGSTAAIAISGYLMVGRPVKSVIFEMQAWRLMIVGTGLLHIFGSSLLSLIPVSPRQMVAHQRLVSASILLRRFSALHKSVNEETCGNLEIQQFSNIERQRHRLQHSNGCIYFLCRWFSYTLHMFDIQRMLLSLLMLSISGCLFNGTLLLNTWLSERISKGAMECYLIGARPMNETQFLNMCDNHKPHLYHINVYLSIATFTAVAFLTLIIDSFHRKLIMAFCCTVCAAGLFAQMKSIGFEWGYFAAIMTTACHAIALSTLTVVIMENYPTKFRCTALGMNSLVGIAVNTAFSFIWKGKCSDVFPAISYICLGTAVLSTFLPNLNKSLIAE